MVAQIHMPPDLLPQIRFHLQSLVGTLEDQWDHLPLPTTADHLCQ